MPIKFTNNASATLAAGINASATTLSVTAGHGARFPTLGASDYFFATLVDASNNLEIVRVTARSGDTLTVVRGQDGTTARSFVTGNTIELRLTAAALAALQASGGGATVVFSDVPPTDTSSFWVNTTDISLNVYYQDADSAQWVGISGPQGGGGGGGGGGGASVSIGIEPPETSNPGDLWWDSESGQMFVYFEDADSSQWVAVIGRSIAGQKGETGEKGNPGIVVSATAPAGPAVNDLWLDIS
jgi:hypothetical protein